MGSGCCTFGGKDEGKCGTDLDPTDGGDLYTPKGKRIALEFAGNLWKLPMWSSPSRCESSIDMYKNDVGKESAQKFMKQIGALKAATLYFAS